jgi:hypothetical protein
MMPRDRIKCIRLPLFILSNDYALQARLRYKHRTTDVGHKSDDQFVSDAEKLIERGRLTVVEYMLMAGLIETVKNPKHGKTTLDEAISNLEAIKTLKQSDVNDVLWHFSSKALRGEKLV